VFIDKYASVEVFAIKWLDVVNVLEEDEIPSTCRLSATKFLSLFMNDIVVE
jgi:hypothetical protein